MSSLSELRKVIREEVRKAMQEELREILVEAVQIASTPEKTLEEELEYERPPQQRMPSRAEVREQIRASFGNPLGELLQETRAGMTSEEVMGGDAGVSGYSEELPAFVARAKAVFDASNKIKTRPGGL